MGGVERVLLDTAGGPHPGGTGTRADVTAAAAIAREMPITLAGGLTAENARSAIEEVGPYGLDVCGGVRTAGALDERRLAAFMSAAGVR